MGDFFSPTAQWDGLQQFMETGGPVLLLIMFAAFVLWSLILERYAYWRFSHPGIERSVVGYWNSRDDKSSWYAHVIREQLISEVRQKAEANVELIKTVLAIAPLLGLLGTVTGMVVVFDVMAITGSSNARLMSGGVSRATIPTMAGMVVALSGLFFSYELERLAKQRVQRLGDRLDIHDH
jgi:biopolymer transport protein ExbB